MNDVTDLRIRKALAEVLDTTPMVRPLDEVVASARPVGAIAPRPARRTGLYVTLGAAAALLLGAVVWPRSDEDRLVSTVSTGSSPGSDAPTTTPSPTTSIGTTTTNASTTTTAAPEPDADHVFADFRTPDLGEVAVLGGPLEIADVPAGWDLNYSAEEAPADVAWVADEGSGWSAYLGPLEDSGVPPLFSAQTPGITLAIEHLLPGELVPASSDAKEVTVGEWTGWLTEPILGRAGEVYEPYAFASELPGGRRFLVTGFRDLAELESIIAILDPDLVAVDNDAFDVSPLEERYDVTDSAGKAPGAPQTERLWRTGYWMPEGMLVVTVRLHAAGWITAARTEPPVQVGSWRGLGSNSYLFLNLTPDISIELSGDPVGSLADLVGLAEKLVPVSDGDWQSRTAATAAAIAHPDRPKACTNPSPSISAVRVNGLAQPLRDWTAEVNDQIEIDVTTPDGITIGESAIMVQGRAGMIGYAATFDHLSGTQTISFTWDGRLDGTALPPGRYELSLDGAVSDVSIDCGTESGVETGWGAGVSLGGGFAIYE